MFDNTLMRNELQRQDHVAQMVFWRETLESRGVKADGMDEWNSWRRAHNPCTMTLPRGSVRVDASDGHPEDSWPVGEEG